MNPSRLLKKCRVLRNKIFLGNKPSMVKSSFEFLEDYLQPSMLGFEWGSGASTIYFSTKIKHLISIEHDVGWYKTISNKLKRKNLEAKIDYFLIEPLELATLDKLEYSNPELHKKIYQTSYPRYYYYSKCIQKYPNNYFAFISIDGRAREDCIICGISKIKKGGIIILDDSEREKYKKAYSFFDGWERHDFTAGTHRTSIWKKPLA